MLSFGGESPACIQGAARVRVGVRTFYGSAVLGAQSYSAGVRRRVGPRSGTGPRSRSSISPRWGSSAWLRSGSGTGLRSGCSAASRPGSRTGSRLPAWRARS